MSQYILVKDIDVPMTKAAMLQSMSDQLAGLNRHTAEANARIDALMGVPEDGDNMTNTAWAEVVARSLEWDRNDLRKNGEFLSVVTKALGAGVVPTAAETHKIAKRETLGFTKTDVDRLAGLLDAALAKGGHVIEGTAYSQYPALHACWTAAPYGEAQKDETITKSWSQQDVAERAEALLDTMAEEQAEVRGVSKELAYSKILETDQGELLFQASQARGTSPKQFVRKMLDRYQATEPVRKVAEALGSDWQ